MPAINANIKRLFWRPTYDSFALVSELGFIPCFATKNRQFRA